jgi:Domain of unknown function (DUF4258)
MQATTVHHDGYDDNTSLHNHLLTCHAQRRMAARSLSSETVAAVLAFGRSIHARGAEIHVIGRKEIAQYRPQGIDLTPFEGVQLVCARDGAIITVYRNRDLRRLRPHKRSRRCSAKWTRIQPSAT